MFLGTNTKFHLKNGLWGQIFTNILQTNPYFTNKFTNSTNKIQNTNGYKNIVIDIDIDIDILVNFVRFQRTEI